MNNEITIILPVKEAERWKYFQEHYDEFVILIDNTAFDVQFGKTTLNFANGDMKNVVKEEIVWKK
jgi:hypothetical protein